MAILAPLLSMLFFRRFLIICRNYHIRYEFLIELSFMFLSYYTTYSNKMQEPMFVFVVNILERYNVAALLWMKAFWELIGVSKCV
jgi:hypothetical protein